MEINELRIGNLVKSKSGLFERIGMREWEITQEDMAIMCDADNFKETYFPIQLTDEWAIKFGYECLVEMACDFSDESIYDIEITSVDLIKLKVHEAQNLYLDLTQKELELKD